MGRPVTHFEIGCRDLVETGEFYAKLFAWKVTPPQGRSADVDTAASRGISGHLTSLGHEPYAYLRIYVEVEDVAATVATAEALGGKSVIGPLDIPGEGEFSQFAWLQDPAGNVIGLLKRRA